MTFLGVPIFDWVLLLVVLGFGVETWITCRDKGEDPKSEGNPARTDEASVPAKSPAETAASTLPPSDH